MDLGLQDRKAFVTGGSRGLGASIVYALAREGCDVAFTHWEDPAGAEEVETAGKVFGRTLLAMESDASGFEDAERAVGMARTELGGLDIVVCNAGIASDRVLWKMTEAQWDRVLAVNLKGCFNACRAAASFFREQRSGKIVNIASINGLRGKFGQTNYAASKGGMIAFTKAASRELGPSGINVNVVAPGMIRTDMTSSLSAEVLERAVRETSLGRIAEPEEIAAVVVFLCSERARHVTGQCIVVDGGQLA